MQRVQFQAGFILHHRVFRESSLIADVLTPDYGVVRLVARGARSAGSKSRPLIQVFRPLLLSWSGRGEMKTLAGIEEQGMPVVLQGLQLACGYYLNEILLRLLRFNESNVILFAHYASTLSQLAEAETQADTESCLRAFEFALLESLGLVPDFSHCVIIDSGGSGAQSTNEPLPGRKYLYFPETGQAIAVKETADSVAETTAAVKNHPASANETLAANAQLVSGDALLALAAREFNNQQCRTEVKKLMRKQLALHLGAEPLKSREMIGIYSKPARSRQTGNHLKGPQDG